MTYPAETQTDQPVKLFDNTAIALAVFFGSPLAGGWALRKNFIALDRRREGDKWMFISIMITLALFATVFILPEDTPRSLFTLINTGLMALYAEGLNKKFFGSEIQMRKATKTGLLSRWWAVLAGTVSMVMILGILFGGAYILDDFSYNTEEDRQIKAKMAEISRLEKTTDDLAWQMDNHPMSDRQYTNSLNTFQGHWRTIEFLAEEVEQLAAVNDRKGTLDFMKLYRQIPPLKIKLAEAGLEISADWSEAGQSKFDMIQRQLEEVEKKIEAFYENLDDSQHDIAYLFP